MNPPDRSFAIKGAKPSNQPALRTLGRSVRVSILLLSATVLADTTPTAFEQYALEIVNRARANPAAEVARYSTLPWGENGTATPDINEGLNPNNGLIGLAAKQPIAFNVHAMQAAQDYSQTLLDNDTFTHTYNNTTAGSRMADAGYTFAPGQSNWGENITYSARSTGPWDINAAFVDAAQPAFFIDGGIPDRGHRRNMMNQLFTEAGIGFVQGTNYGPYAYAILGTWDFAYTSGNRFLTGVAYSDVVTTDHFYTPAEGTFNVLITATPTGGGAASSVTTWSSGGYSLQLANGTYNVTASGPGIAGTRSLGQVTMNSLNQKLDVATGDIYSSWRARFFTLSELGNSTISGANADTESDGLINLLEFALNSNPKINDRTTMVAGTGTRGLPLIRLETISGQARLTGEYVRRRPAGAPDITYIFQFSSDLSSQANWVATGTEVVTQIDEIWERVKVTDSTANPARRFGRLKITQP